ncbi:hypothetical protein Tco_0946697 [Tanacetum coccineum]
MQTRSARQDPTTPYFEPERFIHQTLRKKKKQNPFIPIDDRVPKARYPPFENLVEAEVVYNPFLDLPFPMADNQPMSGNNRVVAPTPGVAIVAVDLRDNFIVKGHHLSMIKDRQFDGRSQTDPHKHIAEFVKVFGMFCYGNTNANAIKLKLFPSSLAGEAKIWFNELSPVKQGQKNHQAAIQDLETKFGRISDHQSSRPTGTLLSNTQTNPKPSTSNNKPYRPPPARSEHVNAEFTRSDTTYDPPVNPNAKPAIFLNDSEDEADEVDKEAEPLPKKPTHANPPPLKAYKPKISYPQRLHKEKMEA